MTRALLPHFIAIRNGDDLGIDIVRQGNEHVLGARFADADFFVREDLKLKLEEYRPKLASLTFHTKLGSMLDKSDRMLQARRGSGGPAPHQGRGDDQGAGARSLPRQSGPWSHRW
jgi:glycyl-tRNA synthetase beta subunit